MNKKVHERRDANCGMYFGFYLRYDDEDDEEDEEEEEENEDRERVLAL